MNLDKRTETEKMEHIACVTTNDVEELMIVLRQQPVLIDCDVATLYGVQTKEVNQAVRNNPDKFPAGYIFRLDHVWWEMSFVTLAIFTLVLVFNHLADWLRDRLDPALRYANR